MPGSKKIIELLVKFGKTLLDGVKASIDMRRFCYRPIGRADAIGGRFVPAECQQMGGRPIESNRQRFKCARTAATLDHVMLNLTDYSLRQSRPFDENSLSDVEFAHPIVNRSRDN